MFYNEVFYLNSGKWTPFHDVYDEVNYNNEYFPHIMNEILMMQQIFYLIQNYFLQGSQYTRRILKLFVLFVALVWNGQRKCKGNNLYSITSRLYSLHNHCRQRALVENVPSASVTSHLGMIDIQATTQSKYYDHNSIIIS